MNTLRMVLRRFATLFSVSPAGDPHPECMTLTEWADLPVHHPRADAASC